MKFRPEQVGALLDVRAAASAGRATAAEVAAVERESTDEEAASAVDRWGDGTPGSWERIR